MKSYRERLKEIKTVYINGELIQDVTKHEVFKGAINIIEQYYNLQESQPDVHCDNNQNSISLMVPTNKNELEMKRNSYKAIADLSYGMLGRTPDFMNAALATLSEHADFLGEDKHADYISNIKSYYEYVKENNLFIGHGAINPQIDRNTPLGMQDNQYAGVHVLSENESGIVVHGAKMIVTMAPISDELLIFNMPGLRPGDENFAVAFALPVNTPGVKLVCRKSTIKNQYSLFDYPISNQFDEIDAYLVLENVEIPWDRVFIYKDINKSNSFYDKSFIRHHTGHQGIVRALSKAEFLTGIAIKVAQVMKLDKFINVQEQLGELTSFLEIIKASIFYSEEGTYSEKGVLNPNINIIQSVRYHFPPMYEKMIKLIQDFTAGSLLSTPHERDLLGSTRETLLKSLSTEEVSTEERILLLNLAWDVSSDGFGQRQMLYEYNHAGSPILLGSRHYLQSNQEELKNPVNKLIKELVKQVNEDSFVKF